MADAQKVTEGEMLGLLRQRHTEKAGNGDAWAFVTHVRSAAGFDAKRTIDGLAMALWPSRGLELIGYEVKCSRSDWQRELKNPAKAEEFCSKLDRFYVAVADDKIVREGELPPTWGLIVKRGARLVTKVEAPVLRQPVAGVRNVELPPAFDRSFLAALLREACRVGAVTPAEVHEAQDEARAIAERTWADRVKLAQEGREAARKDIKDFEQASGLRIHGYHRGASSVADLGKAVRVVLDGEFQVENVRNRLERLAQDARQIADFAQRMRDEMTDDPQQAFEVVA